LGFRRSQFRGFNKTLPLGGIEVFSISVMTEEGKTAMRLFAHYCLG
jgi:hypothetical protein